MLKELERKEKNPKPLRADILTVTNQAGRSAAAQQEPDSVRKAKVEKSEEERWADDLNKKFGYTLISPQNLPHQNKAMMSPTKPTQSRMDIVSSHSSAVSGGLRDLRSSFAIRR